MSAELKSQDRIQQQALVNTVMIFQIFLNAPNIMTSLATVSFSRSTLSQEKASKIW
jgi:hypothetical protein